MLARLLLLLPIILSSASGQVPTYSVVGPNDSPSIVTLTHKLDFGGAQDGLGGAALWDPRGGNAAKLTDVPNIRLQGTRMGNWLTKEQARELLAVPDRKSPKGRRDYGILALLVGCGLRRKELVSLRCGRHPDA